MEKRPLRICLLGYRSNPHSGGQGGYIRNLSSALVQLGHRVDVVSGPPYPELNSGANLIRLPSLDLYDPQNPFRLPRAEELTDPINLTEWIGISTMGFPEPFTFGLRAARYIARHRYRYDVIHDNQSLCYGLCSIKKRLPTLATIHHPITVDRRIAVRSAPHLWQKLKELRWYSFLGMQKRVARTLPHIITVSDCARKDICRQFRVDPERFSIIPNGINTELFYPIDGIEREKNRIIVTNSADTPLKGLTYLLDAVAEIAKKRDILLVVVGTPKKKGMVVKRIQSLGIGNLVRFTGRISYAEFVRQYARAAAAVIPSVYEGFGLPAGEAMACGVPVISTTGGALPEVVGDAGVLVPPADSRAIAKALASVLDNPEYARRLSEAGYLRVHRHLTWKAAAENTVAAYYKVIRQKAGQGKT
ncbi:MAG: glycosyltransferase family 4 protein [Desulfosalsimonadaceae bacterium]